VEIPRMSLGCGPCGDRWAPVPDDQAIATVRAAFELGIRYFDTAPLYGVGKSERRLGLALAGLPRDQVTVSTKVGRVLQDDDGTTPPTFDYTPDAVKRSLEGSHERLMVRGIDLSIRQGEVFAWLGPNGAGKTTTIEILEGYRTRDGGEFSVLGVDPGRERSRLRSRIGIVLQSTGIDRYLTVRETISMYATFYPHPRPVDEVIDLVGLKEKSAARVLKLSGGQQRRLDVAVALVGNPELLFLDEPTTGFDPSARHEAWEVIKNLATLGMTVLLTTHYMDEAQFLADR